MGAFDLDQFAPAPVSFKLRGVEYTVDGDVDVDVVARMLRIENQIEESEGDIEEILDTVREGRDLILEMVQQRRPEVTELKIGAQELTLLFTLILHGSSVAAAVAEAISQPRQVDPATGKPVQTADDGRGEEERDGDEAPLASDTLSSEPSSSSDGQESGLLVTGTA